MAADVPRHLRDRAARTRACRSSTRSSTSATTPSRSASYAPWGDLEARHAGASASRCSRSTPTGRAGDFDLLAFNLSAELVYTNLLNCIDLAGVPVRAAERRPEHPLVGAGGHCTYNPEPLADFVDFVRARRRRGGRVRDHRGRAGVEGRGPHRGLAATAVLRELSHVPGVYVPSMYDVAYDGARLRGGHAAVRRRARAGREAHDRRPRPTGPTRSTSSCRSPRWCTTASTSRSSGAAPAAAGSARPA